ncbi:unnamed protein product [Closterium sp. Yama58-4]|nr:unnamed protein product [Closterium sp. Yama58-4]
MVDFILAIDDPLSWHAENLRHNRGHYSSLLATFGSRAVVAAADRVGVGVHFNPFVPHSPLNQVKYGVIATRALQSDLATWQHLYISGRLHKPVEILIPHDHILSLQSHNLRAAVAAALLLLPQTFSEHELYEAICCISYAGDVRMALAEDPNKISRIVSGGFHHFRSLYRSALEYFDNSGCLHCISSSPAESSTARLQSNRLIGQEISTTSRRFLLQLIPASIRASLSHRLLPTPPYLPRSPLPSHFHEGSAPPIFKMWEKRPTNQTPIHPRAATSAALSHRLALSVSRTVLCAELAAELARRVRISSARQAVAGVLAAAPAHFL